MEETRKSIEKGTMLPVMESFYTIQGEGSFTGCPAYFIRLGGCDVGCVWCDVKESWEAGKWPVQTIDAIVEGALQYPGRLVVITGGEPLMYDLDPLTSLLKEKGFTINIETSGTHPFSGHFDWVCFSPKKFKAPHESIFGKADELKVIVFHKSDFVFAEKHAEKVRKDCRKLLQPEWSKSEKYTSEIINYVKNHPDWNISLQTHKFMDIP
ncbi:7-carboxy-7-deazaguanine synthase QueE [Echinicola sp. CAU 1574]|uniref:7-carboxy-7-deazaguanine synthase n=1 Tax=Echinicola arenosa TaxID=2774144 RepID=A0ABR9ASA3_9BACT|nr:7-carboxy-7-deazaguanine synthase QueE [Echinicola arenosa]MBD8491237.1 7-carboxy-7-deazaguanine synthase QueE [Echinicola arenosa]